MWFSTTLVSFITKTNKCNIRAKRKMACWLIGIYFVFTHNKETNIVSLVIFGKNGTFFLFGLRTVKKVCFVLKNKKRCY